ncbi:MAG: ribosome maturation factor RimP [Spirochaetia bacterium]
MIGENLESEISSLLDALGFFVVELQSARRPTGLHVSLVVYKRDGLGVDDIAEVHRTVLPRIELIHNSRDVHLEVSSPGISRTFKSNREFAVFRGRAVFVLSSASEDWIQGYIEDSNEHSVILRTQGGNKELRYSDIRKTKLDEFREVR